MNPPSIWLDLVQWLVALEARLPKIRPDDMPPEESPKFWWLVAQTEMQMRDTVSAKLRSLVETSALPTTSPWEAFLIRKRLEWATQAAQWKVREGVEPPEEVTLQEIQLWALVTTWETDGCIALWNNAEREGKPPPGAEPLWSRTP